MPEVIVAIGSNMGDRVAHMVAATAYLGQLSKSPIRVSGVYESEPVGPGSAEFLNAVVAVQTTLLPNDLLPLLKDCERMRGRDPMSPRWSDRPLDMDIIGWGNRKFRSALLQVPHASYRDRLFVLLPLRDVCPNWTDPDTLIHIDQLIKGAMPLQIRKTDINLVQR